MKKTTLAKVAAGLAMASAVAGATAQDRRREVSTGSLVPRKPAALDSRQKERLLGDFATCVVKHSPSQTRYFLLRSDDFTADPALGNVEAYLKLGPCLKDVGAAEMALDIRARISSQSLRNQLAEVAYLAAHHAFEPPAADSPPAPPRLFFAAPRDVPTAQANAAFSDCAVAANAAGADKLLRTRRSSQEERAAAFAMAPALSACLIAGRTMSLTPASVRGYSAVGLWQLYEAAKPTG
jgi:hypothetical protein